MGLRRKLNNLASRASLNTTRDWQLRCTKCGRTKSLAEAGGVRIGAWSSRKRVMKWTLGFCRGCSGLRAIAIERIPEDMPGSGEV